jgi:hypothetical protein
MMALVPTPAHLKLCMVLFLELSLSYRLALQILSKHGRYGGIYDLVMEDCVIGDEFGSSPWAIKYKSHQNYIGTMQNHTYKNLKVGKIWSNSYQQRNAGYFISVELRYHPLIPNRTCTEYDCPLFKDVRFENISISGAQRAGDINGFKGDLLTGLSFKNVTFKDKPKLGWSCGYTDLRTFSAVDVDPPLTCVEGAAAPPAPAPMGNTCNATMHTGMSIGGNAYKQLKGATTAACCAACVADTKCAAFVTGGAGECA